MQPYIFVAVFITKPNMRLKYFFLLIGMLALFSCNPEKYISKDHYFDDKWVVSEVVAPSYPPRGKHAKSKVMISFPRQGEFKLQLSAQACRGTYEANTDGYIQFLYMDCNEQCCETDWDYYVLTLIRKASRYKGGNGQPFYLHIDNDNYLILEVNTEEISTEAPLASF